MLHLSVMGSLFIMSEPRQPKPPKVLREGEEIGGFNLQLPAYGSGCLH